MGHWKERGSLGYIAPLGETRSPPLVVFRDWVVLGEVEGEEFRFHWMEDFTKAGDYD
jgi:hypothetical protein